MTKYFQVVPADVLPEDNPDYANATKNVHVIKNGVVIGSSYYSHTSKKWVGCNPDGWLRPLPADTVIVSDLDAVAELIIAKLHNTTVEIDSLFYGLPVNSESQMAAMKEAVKEILKQQDNG